MGKLVVTILGGLLDLLALAAIIGGAIAAYVEYETGIAALVGAFLAFVLVVVVLGVHYLVVEAVRGLYRIEQALDRLTIAVERQASAGARDKELFRM